MILKEKSTKHTSIDIHHTIVSYIEFTYTQQCAITKIDIRLTDSTSITGKRQSDKPNAANVHCLA